MSNCILFAFYQWFKFGGYIIVRKSRYGMWPHFMWTQSLKDLEIVEYVPVKVYRKLYVPPPVFKGYVRRGKDKG